MNLKMQLKPKSKSYYNLESPKGVLLFSIHDYQPEEAGGEPGFYIREEEGITAILPEDFTNKKFSQLQTAVKYCNKHLDVFVNSISYE